jgi:hypothetical protein
MCDDLRLFYTLRKCPGRSQSLTGSGSEVEVLCTFVRSNQVVQPAVTFELLWMMMNMTTTVSLLVVVSQNLKV